MRYSTVPLYLLLLAFLAAPAGAQLAGEDLDAATEAEALEREAGERFAQGDNDGAVELYRRAVALHQDADEKVRILLNVAYLEHLAGRDVAAILTMTDALGLRPEYRFQADLYTEAFEDLFYRARERAIQTREIRAADLLDEGLARLARDDYDGARRALNEALEYRPGDATILFDLALVELEAERWDEALAGFEKVLTLAARPDAEVPAKIRAQALAQAGYLYSRRDQNEAAQTALAEAVTLAPEDRGAWTNLGIVRRALGQREAAAEAFRRAHALAPNEAGTISNLALAYLDAEDWRAAADLLDEATRRFPDDPRLALDLGLARRGLGEEAAALAAFESVLRLDADNRKGLAATAAAYAARLAYRLQDHARALTLAQKAAGWRPELTDAWIVQALAQRALGATEEARKAFEEARRLDPTRADVYDSLGAIYYQLGRLDDAEAAFRRALEIRPDLESARANLAAVAAARAGAKTAPPPPIPAKRPAPPPGRQRPASGLRYADIDYGELGVNGAMVAAVAAGSPAEAAGLQRNDLILQVDGRPVKGGADLELYLDRAGDQVTLEVLRESRPLTLTLRPRP